MIKITNKRYLVTGGAGFIGSNFIKHLLNSKRDMKILCYDKLTYAGNLNNLSEEFSDDRFSFVKGDICDRKLVNDTFSEFDPDHIINFAAESHVDRSINEPDIFVKTNVLGTQVLLDSARQLWKCNGKKHSLQLYRHGANFIQVSTDEVYGSLGKTGAFREDTPLDPHSPYSASKAGADMIARAYYDTYAFPVAITRCSNNYGPYQFPEKLIPLMINNILHGKELPVYGNGSNVRDWIYVDDHCQGIMEVLENGMKDGQVYNIGGACELRNIDVVRDLIRNIRKIMKETPERQDALHTSLDNINENLITFVKDRPGHDFRYSMDFSKLRNETAYYPKIGFNEGIKRTIEWYLDNDDWVNDITSGDYMDYYKKMYEGR